MLKLTQETMQNAIQRAKTVHPKVRVISAANRTYAVSGSKGSEYTVRFLVVNGVKLAECSCPARGMCFHISAAAVLNIAVQSQRQQNPTPAESRDFLARNVGWTL